MRCYNAGRTTTNEQVKIELLSQWMLGAEFRNIQYTFDYFLETKKYPLFSISPP